MKINLNTMTIEANGRIEKCKSKQEVMQWAQALSPRSFGIMNMPYEAHKRACIKFGYLTK